MRVICIKTSKPLFPWLPFGCSALKDSVYNVINIKHMEPIIQGSDVYYELLELPDVYHSSLFRELGGDVIDVEHEILENYGNN